MKRRLRIILALVLFSVPASAQLPFGTVAKDFTFKDLSGNTYNLYQLVASGKTVFIDHFTTWCSPCWAYHQTGELNKLWKLHGPAGAPGVDPGTTNDVVVLSIELNWENSRALLYGASSGSTANTTSLGDWVTGTQYPIIDSADSALVSQYTADWNAYALNSVYMVCQDRLVYCPGPQTASNLYALSKLNCPAYPAAAAKDVKALAYDGKGYFLCNAAPDYMFQNYSQTDTIKSATINTYSGTTLTNTYAWTGKLAPYEVVRVPLPLFAAGPFSGYSFEVKVANDIRTSNDQTEDSIFKAYTPSATFPLSLFETFDNGPGLSYQYQADEGAQQFNSPTGGRNVIGMNGLKTNALLIDMANTTPKSGAARTTDFLLGNFNTQPCESVALEFDLSFATPYPAYDWDTLLVQVSNDCGATWKTGAQLAGSTIQTTGWPTRATSFTPSAASQWQHKMVDLSAHKSDNMLIRLKVNSSDMQQFWIDNIRLTAPLGINHSTATSSVSVYPNPARKEAIVDILNADTEVSVELVNTLGQLVSEGKVQRIVNGRMQARVDTDHLAAGVYLLIVQSKQGRQTIPLSVTK